MENTKKLEEKLDRLSELLEKVIWEAAKEKEIKEFQDLWMEKVESIALSKKEIDKWLKIEVLRSKLLAH